MHVLQQHQSSPVHAGARKTHAIHPCKPSVSCTRRFPRLLPSDMVNQKPHAKQRTQASFLDSLTTIFGGKKVEEPVDVKAKRPASVQKILDLVSGGAPVDQSEVAWLVLNLQQEQEGTVTTSPELLTATWRMLWTTEKVRQAGLCKAAQEQMETQFIVDNAGIFGTKAGDVFQVIDVAAGRLQNVITFPPEGAFVVDSSIEVQGSQRVAFKFNSAQLQLPEGRKIGLPPFGKGWFDNIYVDEEVRIARDIRDDILVVTRDGPPRTF